MFSKIKLQNILNFTHFWALLSSKYNSSKCNVGLKSSKHIYNNNFFKISLDQIILNYSDSISTNSASHLKNEISGKYTTQRRLTMLILKWNQ